MTNYMGANWVKQQCAELSPFGERVADLLGELYRGIYHINYGALMHKRTDWTSDTRIEIVVPDDGWFGTFDGNRLTNLVILCHDACIKCDLRAANIGYLRLIFYPRKGRTGDIYDRHPTIEEAIKACRGK